jgi:DNA-binding MarR family transcriptional regulator
MDPRPCHSAELRRAANAVARHYDRVLAPTGLTALQLSMLHAVAADGPSRVSELADHLGLDRTTLARRLRTLIGRGLLREAQGSADRRTRVVELTELGGAAIRRAEPLWQEAQALIQPWMDSSRLDRLLSALAEYDHAA